MSSGIRGGVAEDGGGEMKDAMILCMVLDIFRDSLVAFLKIMGEI